MHGGHANYDDRHHGHQDKESPQAEMKIISRGLSFHLKFSWLR